MKSEYPTIFYSNTFFLRKRISIAVSVQIQYETGRSYGFVWHARTLNRDFAPHMPNTAERFSKLVTFWNYFSYHAHLRVLRSKLYERTEQSHSIASKVRATKSFARDRRLILLNEKSLIREVFCCKFLAGYLENLFAEFCWAYLCLK